MGEQALPATMPAAVYRGSGVLEVAELPVPGPGPGQVLLEIDYCGVCGSDLHLVVEGWGAPGTVAGHEFTGTVRAVGAGVTAWAPGDVVVGGPGPRCGHCRRCIEGKPSQCENRGGGVADHLGGGFARYTLVDGAALLGLPDGMAPRVAALAEPLAVALHGITRARLTPGDAVMVFGAGPIGALSIAALVAGGNRYRVTVVEPGERRRQLAVALGAQRVVRPDELERFPRWEPERLSPNAVDAVLECSGKKAAIELGFHQLRRGGRLVLVGAGMEEPSFDPNRLLLNELEICGSFVYDADGFDKALALLASPGFPVDTLVEPADVPLDALGDAMAGLAAGRIAGKVMVVPRVGEHAP